jgi:hypothetical protein
MKVHFIGVGVSAAAATFAAFALTLVGVRRKDGRVRPAWSHDDAIALLRRETGAAFDGRCVAALEAVLGREHPAPALPVLLAVAASA